MDDESGFCVPGRMAVSVSRVSTGLISPWFELRPIQKSHRHRVPLPHHRHITVNMDADRRKWPCVKPERWCHRPIPYTGLVPTRTQMQFWPEVISSSPHPISLSHSFSVWTSLSYRIKAKKKALSLPSLPGLPAVRHLCQSGDRSIRLGKDKQSEPWRRTASEPWQRTTSGPQFHTESVSGSQGILTVIWALFRQKRIGACSQRIAEWVDGSFQRGTRRL